MRKEIKKCRDCQYCEESGLGYPGQFDSCRCPKNGYTTNYSTGEENIILKYCSLSRKNDWLDRLIVGGCGKGGRYFKLSSQKNSKANK